MVNRLSTKMPKQLNWEREAFSTNDTGYPYGGGRKKKKKEP